MGNSLLFAIFALLLITFFATSKSMHVFELIFTYLLVVFIHDLYYMTVSLNLKLVVPSEQLSDVFLRIFYQQIVTPVVVVWSMDRIRSAKRKSGKWLVFVSFIGLLILFKALLNYEGIVHYTEKWKMWWSYSEGALLMLVTLAGVHVYRLVLRKDGIHHELP